MVKVNPDDKAEFYLDGILKDNLDLTKKIITKNWDWVFIVDGDEGSGKSTLAFQIAKYLDKDFDISRVYFEPEDFIKAVREGKLKKYSAVVLDEAFFVGSRTSMTKLNIAMIRLLAECRFQNLFILIVLPSFFDLDKNIVLHRAKGLFHVYHENYQRGFFRFYGKDAKKLLYIFGKKTYFYDPKIHPAFFGRFTQFNPLGEGEYDKVKLQAFEKRNNVKLKYSEDSLIFQRLGLMYYLVNNMGYCYRKIAETENLVFDTTTTETTPRQMANKIEILPNFPKGLRYFVGLKDELIIKNLKSVGQISSIQKEMKEIEKIKQELAQQLSQQHNNIGWKQTQQQTTPMK